MNDELVTNIHEFLAAYNSIHETLMKLAGTQEDFVSFFKLIELLEVKNPMIQRHGRQLRQFNNLRNTIVHTQRGQNTFIAYPLRDTVDEIRRIENLLQNPPKVEVFYKRVITVQKEDTLSKALQLMREHNISQIPVTAGAWVVAEVLNGNSIARWLSGKKIVNTDEVPVSNLLPEIEIKDNYRFIHSGATVYEAAEMFEDSYRDGWYADAILITDNGRNGQQLKGIIVLEDIAPWIRIRNT